MVGLEVRVQVKARRFRVPDVSIMLDQKPLGRIITAPPFIVIEVLSPEDRAKDMKVKVADYLDFGVAYVWVLDSERKTASTYTRKGNSRISSGELRTANPEIILPLSELF